MSLSAAPGVQSAPANPGKAFCDTMTKYGRLNSGNASLAESENGCYWSKALDDHTGGESPSQSSNPEPYTSRRQQKS